MGMSSFKGKQPKQADAIMAKNYCIAGESTSLNSIVSAYLEFAEVLGEEDEKQVCIVAIMLSYTKQTLIK